MDEYNRSLAPQSDANGTDITVNDNTEAESWSPSTVRQGSAGGEVVNYYFPVEVVVAGGLTHEDRQSIQAGIFEDLHDAINRRLA